MSSLGDANEDYISDISISEKPEKEDDDVKSVIKNFLIESELENGKSIFAHLTECIKRILEERPNSAADVFEDFSDRVHQDIPSAKPATDISVQFGLAEIEKDLFARAEGEEEEALPEEDGVVSPLPPLGLTSFFYEQAGVGLGRQETYRVWMGLRTLVNTQPVEKARFWGKILGLEQDYYVAETELRDGEELEEEEEEADAAGEGADDAADALDDEGMDEDGVEEDRPPKSAWKPSPAVPKEEFRTGANRRLYFACNAPGGAWTRLPHVTPAQIVASRQRTRLLTGRLDASVLGGPGAFPGPGGGLESALLRVQIARISAGTQVSPLGFYTFDAEGEEEDEGAEDEGDREEALENPEYSPLRARELLEPAGWVHHTKHVLPQGRCSWWDPSVRAGDDELEEEEEEGEGEENANTRPMPERGPPLLTPISEDVALEGLAPWSLRISSTRIPEYAVALASSNLWPGAHAFSFGKHFENVYIGWGYKVGQSNYAPTPNPSLMTEYTDGAEVMEIADPTVEEEVALKAKNAKAEEGEEEMEEEMDEEN